LSLPLLIGITLPIGLADHAGSIEQATADLLRRKRCQSRPLETMIVQPQLRIGSIDTSVARNRIANGYDGLSFLLIKAPAVDAILFVFFRALFRGGLVLLPVRATNRALRISFGLILFSSRATSSTCVALP
jgi:hypothetical protein